MFNMSCRIFIAINQIEVSCRAFCPGYLVVDTDNLGFLRIVSLVTATND